MPRRKKAKTRVLWTEEEDSLLLMAIHAQVANLLNDDGPDEDESFGGVDDIDWDQIANTLALTAKPFDECRLRLYDLHQSGSYFSTIGEIGLNCFTWITIDPSQWTECHSRVCRESAPAFRRRHLPRENRDPQEFVNTVTGACCSTTNIADSITTVNDALIPVDIFGKPIDAAEKAHLLPKAKDEATKSTYPACAVLGLNMSLEWTRTLCEKQC